ncbi:MAG TPA: hypothetical protein VGM06_06585 [Polyangiaceae bacterium]|jgi:hypothetical protein
MMPFRKHGLEAQRFAERRRREDEAPKLSGEVPALQSLKLEIEEHSAGGRVKYVRRILVDRAPALFLVPCGDPRCVDGDHDLTSVVMRALQARETAFRGSHHCEGSVGSSGCSRDVQFDGTAEYRS